MAQRLTRQDSSSTKEEVHQDTPIVQPPPQVGCLAQRSVRLDSNSTHQKMTLAVLSSSRKELEQSQELQSQELLSSSMDPVPVAKDLLQARPRKGRRFKSLASRAPQHEETEVGC